jgi:flagellar basal body-associated protein FliL
MTDERPTQPTSQPDSYDRAEPRKATRNIPPLIWIILAILVGAVVVFWMQRGGTHVTPQGGTMSQAEQGESYMPPAAATGDAPATPGGTVDPK